MNPAELEARLKADVAFAEKEVSRGGDSKYYTGYVAGLNRARDLAKAIVLNPTPKLRDWLRRWAGDDLEAGSTAERDGGARVGVDIDFRERVVREICAARVPQDAEPHQLEHEIELCARLIYRREFCGPWANLGEAGREVRRQQAREERAAIHREVEQEAVLRTFALPSTAEGV